MLNPVNPWLIAGTAVALLVAGGVGYTKGYLSGVDSLADDLVACNTTLNTVKEQQHALAKANEDLRLVSDRATQDARDAWDAARSRLPPRVIRVRDAACGGDGKVQVSQPAAEPDGRPEESGLGAPGTVALALAEINTRLNNAEQDAAQLAHLIDWIETQERLHR